METCEKVIPLANIGQLARSLRTRSLAVLLICKQINKTAYGPIYA